MRSFDEQAAFGLPYERMIAQTAALLLYPQRLDLTLVRLDAYAPLDFLIVDDERPIAALEVKRRWGSRCAKISAESRCRSSARSLRGSALGLKGSSSG